VKSDPVNENSSMEDTMKTVVIMLAGLALAASASILSGCAQTLLVKDGMTPQQFEADKFDCEQKVVTKYGGYAQMGPGHAVMARQDIFRCMGTKGYREATSEERTAAETSLR
jgi:hypothetical protein